MPSQIHAVIETKSEMKDRLKNRNFIVKIMINQKHLYRNHFITQELLRNFGRGNHVVEEINN